LFWLDGGDFYIAFFDVTGHEPVWRLVQVDRTGANLLEIPDSPQLLSILPNDSSLASMRPNSDEPNLWSTANIRKMITLRLPLVSLLLAGAIASLALPGADIYRSEASPVEEPASNLPVVQWVFGPAELITCEAPAYVLRHLHDELGPGLRIVGYGVGVGDQEARSFLQAERVRAELRTTTPKGYRSNYDSRPVVEIYIVSREHRPIVPGWAESLLSRRGTIRAAVEPYLASAAVRDRSRPGGGHLPGRLWRDATGRLWCGGTCRYGQQCCTFTVNG
jgi:hypothetical protein